jgi:hypothetical protein
MVKTTLYLPEDLKSSVERLAREEGRSEAELFREAVGTLIESRRSRRPRLPLFARGFGDAGFAEQAVELLADGFGRDSGFGRD